MLAGEGMAVRSLRPLWLSGWGDSSGTWQKSRAHQRLTQSLESVPAVTHLPPSHL